MTTTTLARFLGLAVLWGSSPTLIKVGLEAVPPGQLVAIRLLVGAVVLTTVAIIRGADPILSAATWGHIAVAALLANVIPFMLLSYGERATSAGVAGVLTGATPLITMMITTVALPGERPTPRQAVGLLTGFAGVVLVISPWTGAHGSASGRLECLGAATSYAAGFAYVRKFLSPAARPGQTLRGRHDPAPTVLSLAASQLIAAATIQLVLMATPLLSRHTAHATTTTRATISLAALGMLTALAYPLYIHLINDLGATTASCVNYLAPAIAVLIGTVALNEPTPWTLLAGGAVILTAAGYAENRIIPPAGSRTAQHTAQILHVLLNAPTHAPAWGLTICLDTGLRSTTVSTILSQLEERGWVHIQREIDPPRGRPPRHYYTLTPLGRTHALQSNPTSRHHPVTTNDQYATAPPQRDP